MTTVDKVHDIFMGFKGRSPRQVYVDAACDLGCKPNSRFTASLSDVVDDFYYMEELDVAGNYFGPKGCLAVLKIVQCQQRLKTADLSGTGADDAFTAELVEVMQDHPRLRAIRLNDNPLISVYSGKGFARVVKLNVNFVELQLRGTHIGDNAAKALQQCCDRNRRNMEVYFSDDWFRMKDMFCGLDVDGSGWVNIKNVVGSVVFPLVQEKLQDRIVTMKPRKREDNCIDVTTFFELTYLNFKTQDEIVIYAENDRDPTYDAMTGNWASLIKAMASQGGCTSSQLYRVHVGDVALTEEQAARIVSNAVDAQKRKTDEDGDPAQDVVDITAGVLQQAVRAVVPRRNNATRNSFLADVNTKVWTLPPTLVRAVLTVFENAPPQGLVASTVLDGKYESPYEFLKLRALRQQFQRFSIPVECTLLTMPETVNLFEEYYDTLRVPKPMSFEQVKAASE